MTFLPECGADILYFSRPEAFSLIKWVHNDFMYVRFGGMRNTKTWSKSTFSLVYSTKQQKNHDLIFNG